MLNTNTKEVSKKIQDHILGNFESYDDMMNELKNYQKNFGGSFGKTYAQEGNLLVYESEVDKFFQDVLKQTPEEQGKYSPKETWKLYTSLIQREAAHIVSQDNRCYIKPEAKKHEKATVKEGFNENGQTGPTERDLEAKRDFKKLATIMATGRSENVFNKNVESDISIDKGHTGREGYGLLHIIEGRHAKDRLGENETTALLYKVQDAAKNGRLTDSITIRQKDSDERIGIEKDGIVAIAGRRKGTGENFVITGYEINNKKEEAAEAVQTVIAKYGRTPEFSDFRKQVGAAVSSLQQASHQAAKKSSDIEAAKKAGYVQGVCECVSTIAAGGHYYLGKKLLNEMGVTKKMAKEHASPETFKALESGIFAQRQEQKPERQQRRGRKL
jgi:hypothetical protein